MRRRAKSSWRRLKTASDMEVGWNNSLTSSVGERGVASAASVRLDCARLCREENLGRGLAPLRLPRLRREEQRDDNFHDQHEREGVERGVRQRQVDRVERLREHERREQQLRHEALVVAEHERKRAHRVRCMRGEVLQRFVLLCCRSRTRSCWTRSWTWSCNLPDVSLQSR